MLFKDWLTMCKDFYKFFCTIWDKLYDWITSDKLIDFQIVRKNASLRMVGSSKIGGNELIFDNPKHTLQDSLIRIYSDSNKDTQMIGTNNFNVDAQNKILNQSTDTDKSIVKLPNKYPTSKYPTSKTPLQKKYSMNYLLGDHEIITDIPIFDKVYGIYVFELAFSICDHIRPNQFEMGKVTGNILQLLRINKGKCILSDRVHEHENAYLIVTLYKSSYMVDFGCYRNCNNQRKITRLGAFNRLGELLGLERFN